MPDRLRALAVIVSVAVAGAVAAMHAQNAAPCLCQIPDGPPNPHPYLVGYLGVYKNADWAAVAKTLDFTKMTHLNLAFINPPICAGACTAQSDMTLAGNRSLTDEALKAIVDAAHAHGTKVLISIGGDGGDKNIMQFYNAGFSRRAGRRDRRLSRQEHDIDGVDVDIEQPTQMGVPFTQFVKTLVAKLRPKGKLVTAAVAQYIQAGAQDEVLPLFDIVNVMIYGSYERSVTDMAWWANNKHVPREKLTLGIGFHNYSALLANYPNAWAVDTVGGGTYRDGAVFTYQGENTVGRETQLGAQYGGAMIWELTQDDPARRTRCSRSFRRISTRPRHASRAGAPVARPVRRLLRRGRCRRCCRRACRGARIAGRRRRVIGGRGRAEQFGEDRLQRVGPDLIALERRVQLVARSSCRRTACRPLSASLSLMFRKRIVLPSASVARFALMPVDLRHDGHVVVAREDAVRMIVASGAFWRHEIDDRLQAARDVRRPSRHRPAALPTLFVPASSTITFGFTPSSSPFSRRQRMFSTRSAPQPKSAAFQPKKFSLPVGEELRIVGRAPAARDGVAFEVDVDAALLRLLRAAARAPSMRVLIGARRRPDRPGQGCACQRQRRDGCTRLQPAAAACTGDVSYLLLAACRRNLSAHGMKYFQFGRVGVSAVVLAPGELAVEQADVHRPASSRSW